MIGRRTWTLFGGTVIALIAMFMHWDERPKPQQVDSAEVGWDYEELGGSSLTAYQLWLDVAVICAGATAVSVAFDFITSRRKPTL